MKKIYLLILFLSLRSLAQSPTLDNTFNTNDNGTYEQNIGVQSILAPDGKLLSLYGNSPYNKVIRLNKDGAIDNTFKFSDNVGYIEKIYANSSGKFLTYITNYNGESGRNTLKCYNADGTVNSNFNIPTFSYTSSQTFDSAMHFYDIQYQNDGKIILIGNFSKVNDINANRIVRLNTDGSVDTTFSCTIFPTSIDSFLSSVVMQNDGKYLVGGEFVVTNPITKTKQARLIRLNNDGTLDQSFYIPYEPAYGGGAINGLDFRVEKVLLQSDNKILICGPDYIINSKTKSKGFIRFNTDGSFDSTFSAYVTNDDKVLENFCIQNDGKILFIGYKKIQRLNNDGTFDNTFVDVNTLPTSIFSTIYIQNDKIIYNNDYKSPEGVTRNGITRLNLDGGLDLKFNPQSGTNKAIKNVMVSMDGKILLLGNSTAYNDNGFNYICRLTENGQFDSSFKLDPAISFPTDSDFKNSRFLQQNDGKILLSTSSPIIKINNINNSFIRLNENGSLDKTFNFSSENNIIDYKIQNNGKIVVSGTGPLFTENNKFKLIRLNTDGSLDTSFKSILFEVNLKTFEIQNDNKILVIHPYNIGTFKRLNEDGSLDTSFKPLIDIVKYSKLQPDGKILISYFQSSPYGDRTILGRLNPDGTKDTSFTENYSIYTSITNYFDYIYLTSEGNIIVHLFKNSINNVTPNKDYMLLKNNGTLINFFRDSSINLIAQQNCDNLIEYGAFTQNSEGIKKNNIFRYTFSKNTTPPAPTANMIQSFKNGQTLSDLAINGENIQWYNSQNLCSYSNNMTNKTANQNVVLPTNTLLVDGETYYASQTINGIESNYRIAITVTTKTLNTGNYILESLKIYPNPIESEVTISNNTTIDNIEIYNVPGQILFSKKNNTDTTKLDFSNFNSGVYFIKIYSENKTRSLKVIKK